MLSQTYKDTISKIVRNTMKRKFPGLKSQILIEASTEISRAVHARMYGANVDGVESPIWREDKRWEEEFKNSQPTKTAEELLNE